MVVRPRQQRLVGFGGEIWVLCGSCKRRVLVPALEYGFESNERAPYPVCRCGAEIDVTDSTPVVSDPANEVLDASVVDQVYWYHSSPYQTWPDSSWAAARAEEIRRVFAQSPDFAPGGVDRMIEKMTNIALHVGTYEAAIENILRRLATEDHDADLLSGYTLHRVELRLAAGDVDPVLSEEMSDVTGTVSLSKLKARGARVIRYVNTREARGSISLALAPGAICRVTALPIPDRSSAVTVSSAAVSAVRAAREELARIGRGSDDRSQLRCAVFDELDGVLLDEYAPNLGPTIRDRFLGAVLRGDPEERHARFRIGAGMVANSSGTMARFDQIEKPFR